MKIKNGLKIKYPGRFQDKILTISIDGIISNLLFNGVIMDSWFTSDAEAMLAQKRFIIVSTKPMIII